MDILVIVSLAAVVVIIGAVAVVGRALYRGIQRLRAAARDGWGEIGPLIDELQSEMAVVSLERAALQRTRSAADSAPGRRR
jgi:predicted PurR-regulated permease PerM